MNIKSVTIKNFRNFEDFYIEFSEGYQIIVGENNIGKSNLYRAIRIVLDKGISYRERFLAISDFHGFKQSLDVNDYIQISVDLYSEKLAEFPNFHALKTGENTARVTYIFAHKHRFLAADAAPERIDIKDFDWRFYAGGEVLDCDHIIEHCAPITMRDLDGINLYYLTAFRNINSDLQGGTKSLLSKYCQSREAADAETESIRNILQTSSGQLNELAFIPELARDIQDKGANIAGGYFSFPVALSFLSNHDTEAWNQLNLFFNAGGGNNIPISVLGLGQKNILYLSLFIAELENASSEHEVNILLVEEPEAHLHPQLQKILFANLNSLRTTQVFMSSHSTHIASDCNYKNLNVLFRTKDLKVKSFAPFKDGLLNDRERSLLKRYLDATRSELFFASALIFVEGVGEQFIVPAIAKNVFRLNLTEQNISVIPIHCRYFDPYLKLVQNGNLEIPAIAIIDGDCGELEDGDEATAAVANAQALIVDERVGVFNGVDTLELDLFPDPVVNNRYLQACFVNLGHEQSFKNLVAATAAAPETWKDELIKRINQTCTKGRFAQELSTLIDSEFLVPEYLANAIKYIADCKSISLVYAQ